VWETRTDGFVSHLTKKGNGMPVNQRGQAVRRVAKLAPLGAAWLLLAGALLFVGRHRAVSGADLHLEMAIPGPGDWSVNAVTPLQGAAIIATPTSLTVSEPDGSAAFLLTLATQPGASVDISLTITGPCTITPSLVTLNPSNWAGGRSATVTAVDNLLPTGPQLCLVTVGPTASDDPDYSGIYGNDVTVTVLDDEAGILVAPTGLTVSEPDGSDTFLLTLTREPAALVSIPLSAATGECTVSPVTATLSATNWITGFLATVSAVDDAVADGPQLCTVVVGPAASDDGDFQDIYGESVTVTVEDDDRADVAVVPTSLTVSEPDGSDTFLITLTSQPTASVAIPLVAIGGECTVSPATATLSADNWATGATATVTAVDDSAIDGLQACPVQTGPTVSADQNYDGLDPADVAVTVQDDDVAVVTIAPTSLGIAEPDGSDTFVARLSSEPEADVIVPLVASNEHCSVSPAALVLNAGNWATGATATVTAVDDSVAGGDALCIIHTGPTVSDDAHYQGLDPSDVTVLVSDDDEASILVVPTSLTVSEPSGSDTFTLKLASLPSADVHIPLSAFNDQCTVSPATAILGAANWEAGVTATVTAVDDDVADGTQICLIKTGPAISGDANYHDRNPAEVTVTVEDDDLAAVTVSPLNLSVSEPDGSDTFLVTLTSRPVAQVTIPLLASNSRCTVSPASLVLNATNWALGATATVTAVDDDIAGGDATCVIQTGAAVSADGHYQDIDPENVTVTVLDDDSAGIVVAPTSLVIGEPHGSDVFVIRLTSQPTATVSINLSPSNDECDASPRTVLLGAVNWRAGVAVVVTAIDDDVADGSQICLVRSSLSSSGAAQYHGLVVDDVTVTVEDDDRALWLAYLPLTARGWPPAPGVPVLRPISNAAGLGTYSVAWDPAPRADTYVLEEAKGLAFVASWTVYNGAATSHLVAGRGAARYYYRVMARNSWADSGWSNAQHVDVLWEAEPNDEAHTQANGAIVSGLTYYGTFPNTADVKDYYYFDLSAPRSVELWLSNVASGQNYDLILRNAGLESVGYSAQLGNASEYISSAVLPAGRYYVQVYRYSGTGSDVPYHLKVVYD
jgi:hypothetical protein